MNTHRVRELPASRIFSWIRAGWACAAFGSLLAADPLVAANSGSEFFGLWSPSKVYPAIEEIPFLSVVTHVSVERATPDGYHYLHESGIAVHNGVFHAIWANGPAE